MFFRKSFAKKEDLVDLKASAAEVSVQSGVEDYLLDLVAKTREDPRLVRGVSTRGAEALFRAIKSLAFVRGRNFCIPEDVRELAGPVLAHRVLPRGDSPGSDRQAVEEILWELPQPA